MVYQHGSPFYDEDEETCRAMHKRAYRSFPISRVYQAHIPTCPAGYWLFGFASKKYHPLKDFNAARWNARHIKRGITQPICTVGLLCCHVMSKNFWRKKRTGRPDR